MATYNLGKAGWYPLLKMQNWEATDDDWSNDVIIPFGKGVIITSGEADTTMTFAGQVITEAKTFKVTGGNSFTWTGNATPIDLTLGDFALPVDQGFTSGDSIILAIYGTDGALVGEYSFVDTNNTITYNLGLTGWYPLLKMQNWEATDDDCANNTVTVPAGKMVIITSGEADTTLTIPSAIKSNE